MTLKMGKGSLSNIILGAASAFIVDVFMDEKMRGRVKRGFRSFKALMRQIGGEGADAYKKSRKKYFSL